jgi:hypothetical protein
MKHKWKVAKDDKQWLDCEKCRMRVHGGSKNGQKLWVDTHNPILIIETNRNFTHRYSGFKKEIYHVEPCNEGSGFKALYKKVVK